jgi:hypothetical protein
MRLYAFCISFAAVSSGCSYGEMEEDTGFNAYSYVDDGGVQDADADADADVDADATFSVTWTGYSIETWVTNPHYDGYYLGLAQTSVYGGWYAEDGISGSVLHELYNSLSLGCVTTPGEVVGSSTTLLCDHEATTTYAFFGNEYGDNWGAVSHCGGDDCSYYE